MEASDRTFDLVILADLCPGRDVPPAPQRVDRDTLSEVTQRLAPELTLHGASLSLDDPRAFRPEALAAVLPLTRELLALRRRLKAKPPPSAGELRAEIEKLAGTALDPGALRAVLGADAGKAATPGIAPAATTASSSPASARAAGSGDRKSVV